MKTLHLFLLTLVPALPALCQGNLVTNGGFESQVSCPLQSTQIGLATGWSSSCESPDYFHTCSTGSQVTVPLNMFGRQYPASGDGYAGFHAFDSILSVREILQTKLSQPLTVGLRYYLSMKVSLAEWWINGTASFLPCNNVGMKFSSVPFDPSQGCPMVDDVAHFASGMVSDTAAWTQLQGMFVADSAYEYLMVGNFFTRPSMQRQSRPDGYRSYFYVDDIVVSTSSVVALGRQTGILDVARVYPNPAARQLHIEPRTDTPYSLTLYDLTGNQLMQTSATGSSLIDVGNLSEGLYLLAIRCSGWIVTEKIVVSR